MAINLSKDPICSHRVETSNIDRVFSHSRFFPHSLTRKCLFIHRANIHMSCEQVLYQQCNCRWQVDWRVDHGCFSTFLLHNWFPASGLVSWPQFWQHHGIPNMREWNENDRSYAGSAKGVFFVYVQYSGSDLCHRKWIVQWSSQL